MTEYAHSHPMPEGHRFEHVHRPPAGTQHAAKSLAEAHPELAEVEQAPAPGSPADLRKRAEQYRQEASELEAHARRSRNLAAHLEALADQDEQHPPSEAERVRRLLDRGEA